MFSQNLDSSVFDRSQLPDPNAVNVCQFCFQTHLKGECKNPLNSFDAFFETKSPVKKAEKKSRLHWDSMTLGQKALSVGGKLTAFIMAIGCGAQVYAAFINLALLPAGPLSFFLAGLIFVAGSAINWYIFKTAVPDVLIKLWGEETWFQGLFELKENCDLVRVDIDPALPENLHRLKFEAETAYVIYQDPNTQRDKLYYVNTLARVPVTAIPMSDEKWTRLRTALKIEGGPDAHANPLVLNQAKRLTRHAMNRITHITSHSRVTTGQKVVMGLGISAALSVGITFGALAYTSTFTLANSFALLGPLAPAFPLIASVLAGSTLVCLTALMLNDIAKLVTMENVLKSCGDFAKNLFDFSPRCEFRTSDVVPTKEKLAAFRLNTNAAYIAVQYMDDNNVAVDHVYYVNQELNECYRLEREENGKAHILSSDEFSQAIPNCWPQGNQIRGLKLSHANMDTLSAITHQQPKGIWATAIERVMSTALSLVFIPLALLGLLMTQNACASEVKKLLLQNIPQLSGETAALIAGVTSLGFAFLGQVPFVLSTSVKTIASTMSKDLQDATARLAQIKAQNAASTSRWKDLNYYLIAASLYGQVFINGIGNGLISALGGSYGFAIQLASAIGGTWNSITAGFSAVSDSLAEKDERLRSFYEDQEANRSLRLMALVFGSSIVAPLSLLLSLPALVGALVLTPLSLFLTVPYWKESENLQANNTWRRKEFATRDLEMLRLKARDLKAQARQTYAGNADVMKMLDKLFSEDTTVNPRPAKLVTDSSDHQTKILYSDIHTIERLGIYAAQPLKQPLSINTIENLAKLRDDSNSLQTVAFSA